MYLNTKAPSRLRIWLVQVALVALSFAGGSYFMYSYAKKAASQAYDIGFNHGVNDATWKERALSDQAYSRKLCTAWWFQAGSTERKLK